MKRLKERELLGKGSYGKVFRDTNSQYVVKEMKLWEDPKTRELSNVNLREAVILSSIQHPHLIRCSEVICGSRILSIKMEYGGVTLREWLKESSHDEKHEYIPIFFRQLVDVVYYLWKQGIQHVDIMPDNILIHEGVLRLIDIGMCSFRLGLDADGKGIWSDAFGTWSFTAPEVVCMDRVTDQTPVWNLALMGSFMWTEVNPVESEAESLSRKGISRVLRDFRNELWTLYLQEKPWMANDEPWMAYFNQMTAWESSERMSVKDVYQIVCNTLMHQSVTNIPISIKSDNSIIPNIPIQCMNRIQSRVVPYAYCLWQSLTKQQREFDVLIVTACLAWGQLLIDMLDDRIIQNWADIMEVDARQLTICMVEIAQQKEWKMLFL